MADVDNTFTSSKLNNISQCHSSYGKNNQLAKPKLDRWKDLNNAIIDWMNNDAIEETSIKISEQNNFQFYDKIQKAILSDLFARFRTIYPKNENEFNHDFPIKEVTREINGEEYAITTYFTYEFIDEDTSEFIKLKTAFDPEPELIDKAIITKLKEENEEFFIASLEREDLEEIELIENPDEIIDQHFELLENFLNNKQKRNPGIWCSMGCDMSSRCGQFPLINTDRITNRIREVKVTKTNAIKLVQCERRAAWNVQYGIPKENYIEYESASLGTKFHDYAQSLLVKNNKFREESSVNEFKKLVDKQEDSVTSEKLFKKYKELIKQLKSYKKLSLTKSEYNLGFTIVADGKGLKNGEVVDKKVATIFMGRADLAGRVDDKPLIVELKTRQEHPEDFLEAQLYALGASKLLKTDDVITLHIYISDTETKIKERSFSESELLEAEKKFLDLAEKSASWVPFNALSPKFKIGDWCQYCEFKTTCSENRISDQQQTVISLEEIVNKEKESLESELLNIEKNKEKIFENQKLIIDLQSKEKELQNKIKEKTEKLNKVDELQKSAIKKDEEKLKIIKYEIEEFTKKAINAEMQAKELAEEAKQAKELAEEAKKVKKEAKKVKKEAEEEAKQAKELAEEAKKVKEEFVYFTKRVESAEKEEKRIQEDIQNGETYRKAREQEELLLKQIKEEQAEEAKKLIDNEKKNNLLMVKNQKLIDENYDLEDAKKISEEFSKKFDKNEMQILAYINLKNNVLKNCVQMIIKKAGFGSNSELMSLNERVIREQFIEPIVSFKPDDPYEDLRFMIKILLRSKDLIKVAPALHKLMNYEINKYLKILLQHLNNDAHSNKNEYTDEEILELGMLIIELISNFISTENYEFDEENILREFINEAEGLVRPFKDSLNF